MPYLTACVPSQELSYHSPDRPRTPIGMADNQGNELAPMNFQVLDEFSPSDHLNQSSVGNVDTVEWNSTGIGPSDLDLLQSFGCAELFPYEQVPEASRSLDQLSFLPGGCSSSMQGSLPPAGNPGAHLEQCLTGLDLDEPCSSFPPPSSDSAFSVDMAQVTAAAAVCATTTAFGKSEPPVLSGQFAESGAMIPEAAVQNMEGVFSNPCTPIEGIVAPNDPRASTADARPLFEVSMSYWQHLASIPSIAAALAPFPSERHTRKSGRLDIVQWVATISAFGVEGPSNAAWEQLFKACCFSPDPDVPDKSLQLPVCHIAALLAFTKVNDNLPENVSYSIIVKSRLKPAVHGRTDARCPGILPRVQKKYDNFVYTILGQGYFHRRMDEFSPASILPPQVSSPSLSTLSASSGTSSDNIVRDTVGHNNILSDGILEGGITRDSIEERASTFALECTKKWEQLMFEWLQLDETPSRVQRFAVQRHEMHRRFKESTFNKLSMFLFDKWLSGSARYPRDPSRSQYYRRCSSSTSPHFVRRERGSSTSRSEARLKTDVYRIYLPNERAICSPLSRASKLSTAYISKENTVTTRVTLMELHVPGVRGTAACSFLRRGTAVNDKAVINLGSTTARGNSPKTQGHRSNHRATFRLADKNSPSFLINVKDAEESPCCRELQLIVEVNVLPFDPMAQKRQFRYSKIKSYAWVTVGRHGVCSRCCEAEAISEVNTDDSDALFDDVVQPEWMPKSAMHTLASGESARLAVEDICDATKTYPVKISVPNSILSRVDGKSHPPARRRGRTSGSDLSGSASDTDDSDDETGESKHETVFDDFIRIDCSTSARFEFTKSDGVELVCLSHGSISAFQKLPVWRWRQV